MKRFLTLLLAGLLSCPAFAWQGFVVNAIPAIGSTAPDITTGLIAYLKLDETSGTSAADSAGSHTGTTVNSPTWANPGLTFNGSTQYCTLASAPIIGDKTAFTLAVWFKTTSTTWRDIYMEGYSGSNSSQIYIAADTDVTGDVKFGYRDGPGTWGGFTTAAIGINDGNWHQAVMVQTAKNSRTFYMDGSVVGSSAVSMSTLLLNLSTIAALNQNGTLSNYFSGTVKSLRIYNIALSSTQVSYLYSNGL